MTRERNVLFREIFNDREYESYRNKRKSHKETYERGINEKETAEL